MKKKNDKDWIKVRGARTHNLKNIDVDIPRNAMTIVTGLSGSGKSSLAFDTIFAEGQRRYVESLSTYARQFLNQMQKPDVDEITGLSPAISIDQKSRSNNPRSTVATITEIYDYLRVLFARIGNPHCLVCGQSISKLSIDEIVDFVYKKIDKIKKEFENECKTKKDFKTLLDGAKISIYSPVVRNRKGEHYQMLYDLLSKGYSVVRVDGEEKSLREKINLSLYKKHSIDLLIDEFFFDEFFDDDKENQKDLKMRLTEAVEKSLEESDSLVLGVFDFVFDDGRPKNVDFDKFGLKDFLLSSVFACPEDGFSFGELEPRLFSFNSPVGACSKCNGLGTEFFGSDKPCKSCNGYRLKDEALSVFIGNEVSVTTPILEKEGYKKGLNITDITRKTVTEAIEFFNEINLSEREFEIAFPILKEIQERLSFLKDVGLDYITLQRKASTLSGGEAQRIRLASQLGSGLVGATYILDEPTIGLHQSDNHRLIKTLKKIRDIGNTVIVVEHDEDVIFSGDYLVDIGPKSGQKGGKVVACGFLSDLLKKNETKHNSRTLAYLRGEDKIPLPLKRRKGKNGSVNIVGAKKNNIDNLNISFPVQKFICVTGVSGSGKSTFLYDILYKNLKARFDYKYRSAELQNCAKIDGLEHFSRAILIDQSAIGRTPRSNPATYTGAFNFIREIFAETTESQIRGYKLGRFSFNIKGGRCEACSGHGYTKIEMHFLPPVYVKCDVCNGKRFNKETLEVTYKDKNISDVLNMSIFDAYEFFKDIPAISDRLKALNDVGLGYLKLGQSATTLSGGEAQRVKIASELFRPFTERTIYLLDEPTVGLHYDDVFKLNEILQTLVNRGNTVVVIEHNLDLIKVADWILEFGPKGGEDGGKIIASGTPEDIANNPKAPTAKYLKKVLRK